MVDLPPRMRLGIYAAVTAAGVAVLVGVPAYYLWYAPTYVADYTDPSNTGMFFGLLGGLIGIAVAATGGQELYGTYKDRKRFEELVEGKRKSEFRRNLAELEQLADELPNSYRERLESVKEDYGLD